MDDRTLRAPFGPPISYPPVLGAPVYARIEIHFRDATEPETFYVSTPDEFSQIHQNSYNEWDTLRIEKLVLVNEAGQPFSQSYRDEHGNFVSQRIAA